MKTNSIETRAMLARLNITQWTARKLDKRATAETLDREQAQSTAGRFTKNLLTGADNGLKEIARIATAARTDHYRLTLPWQADGGQILSSALFTEYMRIMGEHQRAFDAAVYAFARDQYPDAREAARFALGQMYDETDYPTPAKIAHRFSFATAIDPLPTAGDFRAELTDDAVNAIRQDIESRTQATIAAAMRETWQRLYQAVSHVAVTLPKYENGDIRRFNDSLIENVRDICRLLPGLNITNDPTLDVMTKEVESRLCRLDAQTLRDSDYTRSQTAGAAADIMKRMAVFMGTTPEAVPAAPAVAPVIDLFTRAA